MLVCVISEASRRILLSRGLAPNMKEVLDPEGPRFNLCFSTRYLRRTRNGGVLLDLSPHIKHLSWIELGALYIYPPRSVQGAMSQKHDRRMLQEYRWL